MKEVIRPEPGLALPLWLPWVETAERPGQPCPAERGGLRDRKSVRQSDRLEIETPNKSDRKIIIEKKTASSTVSECLHPTGERKGGEFMFIQRKTKIMVNQIKGRLLLFTIVSFFLCYMLIAKTVYARGDSIICYAPSINYENSQTEIRITNLEHKGVHITLDAYDKKGNQTQQLIYILHRNETKSLDVGSFPNNSESVAVRSSGKVAVYLVVVSEDKEKVIPFLEYKSDELEVQQLKYSREINKSRALELNWDNRPISLLDEEDFDLENADSLNGSGIKEEGLEEDIELSNSVNTEDYLIGNSAGSLPDMTSTGFYFPIGKSEFRSACGQWLARDSDSANGGCYFGDKYHIGTDMMANEGDPVYAIDNGTVKYKHCSDSSWGPGNCVVAILHKLYNGREFLAIYGHIRTNKVVGNTVIGGQRFATVGPYPDGNHLHFGIRLALTNPAPWGIMPNTSWPDTNGFIDPIYWITNYIPSPMIDRYETDDSATNAKQLSLNAVQNRSIHVAGNTDWIKFTLTQRKTVRIETNGYSGDTEMWLYANDSTTLIEYDDDDGYSLFSMIERALDPGTYYIKIQEYQNNGTVNFYTLSVDALP